MRGPCTVVGAVTAIDGLLAVVFSKRYVRFWGSFNFGSGYKNLMRSIAAFPDTTIRLIGVAQLILAAALLLPDRSKREHLQVEEEVSREHFSHILRGLAESLEKSSDFQTVIKGQQVNVPAQADMKVEYEQKEQGGELELEVKWEGAA
jgi:amphi-Trp domain-containing protein